MDTPARASNLLLLEVIVNNYPTGKIGEFTLGAVGGCVETA